MSQQIHHFLQKKLTNFSNQCTLNGSKQFALPLNQHFYLDKQKLACKDFFLLEIILKRTLQSGLMEKEYFLDSPNNPAGDKRIILSIRSGISFAKFIATDPPIDLSLIHI